MIVFTELTTSSIPNVSPRSPSQAGKVDRTRRIIAPEMGTQAVRLSTREGEVASLVAEGLTNGAIAVRLFISERTVESHLERIRRKLGFHHRSEVAVWIARAADSQTGGIARESEPTQGTAGAREHVADERQRRADQREGRADEREARADQREAHADQHQARADQHEAALDEREHILVERLSNGHTTAQPGEDALD